MLYINGKLKEIYLNRENLMQLFQMIIEPDGPDIGNINIHVIEHLIEELKAILSHFNEIDSAVALRKILDVGLSRHRYDFVDINAFYTFIQDYLTKFHSLPPIPEPSSLENFDRRDQYSRQNKKDIFKTNILYRGVSLNEYIEIFSRREIPCNGNYLSPYCPYRLDANSEDDLIGGSGYEIMLKFTLRINLIDALINQRIIKEAGDFHDVDLPFNAILLPFKNKKQEVHFGIKHENEVISFRMGNSRNTGKNYIWSFQQLLENIEIEKVLVRDLHAIDYIMHGTEGLTVYHLRYAEIEQYLGLLESNYTFN